MGFKDVVEDFSNAGKKTKPVSHVAFILDQSGSMHDIASDMVGVFNEQLKTLREESKDVETKVTLVRFSNFIEEVYFDKDINDVDDIIDYPVYMSTSLLDAIGTVVDKFLKMDVFKDKHSNHSALLIVLTDGDENSSKDYTAEKLGGLIEELDETGKFTFTFLGVGDGFSIKNMKTTVMSFAGASAMGSSSGVTMDNLSTFGKGDTMALRGSMSKGIKSFYSARKTGETMVRDFYEVNDEEGKRGPSLEK